jgi:hypothetical protein
MDATGAMARRAVSLRISASRELGRLTAATAASALVNANVRLFVPASGTTTRAKWHWKTEIVSSLAT